MKPRFFFSLSRIMELTSIADDSQRKLTSTVEQYETVIKKLQFVEQELNVVRTNLNSALNDRKVSESRVQEMTVKITEITNINNQLTVIKQKTAYEILSGLVGSEMCIRDRFKFLWFMASSSYLVCWVLQVFWS